MLPVNGMPKLVMANEDAAARLLSILVPLVYGICVIRLATVVIVPSDTCCSLFQLMLAIC
jgi:hypothetical protein